MASFGIRKCHDVLKSDTSLSNKSPLKTGVVAATASSRRRDIQKITSKLNWYILTIASSICWASLEVHFVFMLSLVLMLSLVAQWSTRVASKVLVRVGHSLRFSTKHSRFHNALRLNPVTGVTCEFHPNIGAAHLARQRGSDFGVYLSMSTLAPEIRGTSARRSKPFQ
jgi:hypothetical protein